MKTMSGTKTGNVLEHLLKKGSITSWEAIKLYRATRLSGIIYNLRYNKGFIITSVWQDRIDKSGKKSRFVRYYMEECDV